MSDFVHKTHFLLSADAVSEQIDVPLCACVHAVIFCFDEFLRAQHPVNYTVYRSRSCLTRSKQYQSKHHCDDLDDLDRFFDALHEERIQRTPVLLRIASAD